MSDWHGPSGCINLSNAYASDFGPVHKIKKCWLHVDCVWFSMTEDSFITSAFLCRPNAYKKNVSLREK